MPDSFTVELTEDGPHEIEAPQSFEATGDFDVFVRNHGEPHHVHVRLDPTLSAVGQVTTPNRFVETGATRRIHVAVSDGERPLEGRLEVVTGYGANSSYVTVTIRDPEATVERVAVDERLGEPAPDSAQSAPDPQRILLFAIGAVLLLLALGTAILTQQLLITAVVLAVLLGVGIAAAVLLA